MAEEKKSWLEKLQAKAWEIISGAIATFLIAALLLAQDYLATLVPVPQAIWAVRAIALAVAAISVAAVSFFYFRPKLVFDSASGTYRDKKSALRYCQFCLLNKKAKSPLREMEAHWGCNACGRSFAYPKANKDKKKAIETYTLEKIQCDVLLHLSQKPGQKTQSIANNFKIGHQLAMHHLEELRRLHYIIVLDPFHNSQIGSADYHWSLDSTGRAYLAKAGLLS